MKTWEKFAGHIQMFQSYSVPQVLFEQQIPVQKVNWDREDDKRKLPVQIPLTFIKEFKSIYIMHNFIIIQRQDSKKRTNSIQKHLSLLDLNKNC